jgi:hypothetical protein
MMRQVSLFLFLLTTANLMGQNQESITDGTISYITTQNVYVKFSSTANIKAGDTLYVRKGDILVPALRVTDLSSISCVCIPLSDIPFKVSDKIAIKPSQLNKIPPVKNVLSTNTSSSENTNQNQGASNSDTSAAKKSTYKTRQQIHGNVSLASYSDFSTYSSTNSQREKVTLSLSARNLGNSNLSAECYISYYQNDNQLNVTSNSVFNSLKIYDFAFIYDFGKKASLSLGRKLNPKLADMGSNDGLQFELKYKPLSIGIIAGFRPNYTDYGFNGNLFQTGIYLFNELGGKKGFMQTTLGFIDQTNSWKTDRRFLYAQYVNSLIKNLTFFGSAEVDIFGRKLNTVDSTFKTNNTPSLTSLYLSMIYLVSRRLGLSFSYSDRQNVIYFETYKSILDRLLDNPTMQGYSLQFNYSPVNNLAIGATGTYRVEKPDPLPAENLYGYITYSQIPGIKTSVTVSTMLMRTSYVNGSVYSAGLSKDLVSGKLYLGLTYRYLDYHYLGTSDIPTFQNMGEFNLTWRIIKKLFFSVYYEGTFEKITQYHNLYAQMSMGF